MIEIFKFCDLKHFGDAFVEQARLRHRFLIEAQGWNDEAIITADGIESDNYDTAESVYIVHRDDTFKVDAVTRLVPTTSPYMIEKVFPHFLFAPPIKDPKIWESSRLVIDQEMPQLSQSRAWAEINIAGLEYNLNRGVKHLIMFMPMWFVSAGLNSAPGMIHLTALGAPALVDGVEHVAVMTEEITPELVAAQRAHTGIDHLLTRMVA